VTVRCSQTLEFLKLGVTPCPRESTVKKGGLRRGASEFTEEKKRGSRKKDGETRERLTLLQKTRERTGEKACMEKIKGMYESHGKNRLCRARIS